jgi:hypothetical protein
MICNCQLLIKKRTILDGIKTLEGTLIVYKIDNRMFINICCAQTIIPAMYTFIDPIWFSSTVEIIDVDTSDAKFISVFEITDKILKSIKDFEKSLSIEFNSNIKFLQPEYLRIQDMCDKAYLKVIELEKMVIDLRFKYVSAIQDRIIPISTNESEIAIKTQTNDEDTKKMLEEIKLELKDQKTKMHNEIGELVYSNSQQKTLIYDLTEKNKKLESDNVNLREQNKLLRSQR